MGVIKGDTRSLDSSSDGSLYSHGKASFERAWKIVGSTLTENGHPETYCYQDRCERRCHTAAAHQHLILVPPAPWKLL